MKPATSKQAEPIQSAPVLNQEKADAFAQRMIGVINDAGIALMTSIGHRTRLFAAMNELKPSTSSEIAEVAGLNERYVREWLGAMVTGGIVDYDSVSKTYSLPREHAAFLTPAAIPNNLGVSAQFVAVLGSVEDQIVECFKKGGGVPYSAYPRFHEVMAEESNQSVCAGLFDSILPLVPKLDTQLRSGANVLDVGCGSGRALNLLAQTYPTSQFTGYDFSEKAITAARRGAEKNLSANVRFEVRDVAKIADTEAFDLITAFDSIHDQARPADVLAAIAQALKSDGVFLMQDIAGSSLVEKNFDQALAPFCYTISCMHCMTVSLEQNGEGLGAMWGEEKARTMLRDAGFKEVQVKTLPHDILNNYFIATK